MNNLKYKQFKITALSNSLEVLLNRPSSSINHQIIFHCHPEKNTEKAETVSY